MISSILARPLKVVSRSTLEALVKNSTDDDLSLYTDEELCDLITELYPRDVLSSFAFARLGVEDSEEATQEESDVLSSDVSATTVDAVLANARWYYVFWNISSHTLLSLSQKGKPFSFFLRVYESYKGDGKEETTFFDIELSKEERERNIYIESYPSSFYVELFAKVGSKEQFLAKSHTYHLSLPYYSEHGSEVPPSLFFEPLLNNEGNLVLSSPSISEFYARFKGEESEK